MMATVLDMADPAGLELGELEVELATLAAHLSAGTCRWLELVGELDRRGGWAEEGTGSCAAWIAWRCGLTARAAREHVRVARRLCGLPQTRAAFAHGVLSYAKVRALTRVATAESEGELLELAGVLTAAQLDADEAVISDDGDGISELAEGSALAPETTRRLACDASVVRSGQRSRTYRGLLSAPFPAIVQAWRSHRDKTVDVVGRRESR